MLRFGCFPVFVMSIAPWVSTSALEADSVVLIDQASAIAGGVTPDAPGFPVTLSQRGSYRLTSNLDIDDPNATAIEITADYVTLDLDGFAITGPADLCEGRLVPVWCSTETQGVGVFASPFLVGPVVLNGPSERWDLMV